MRDLRGQEVEEPVELVRVPAQRGRQHRGVDVGRLDGAHLHLEPAAEALDPPEHADGVALREATVEQLDVLPDATLDPAAGVDELDREVRLAGARREPALARDREDAVDRAVLGELRDRGHGASLGVG